MVEFHFACCAAFAKAKVVFTLIFNSVNILAHDFGDRIFLHGRIMVSEAERNLPYQAFVCFQVRLSIKKGLFGDIFRTIFKGTC